jgi:hypothetical protein
MDTIPGREGSASFGDARGTVGQMLSSSGIVNLDKRAIQLLHDLHPRDNTQAVSPRLSGPRL